VSENKDIWQVDELGGYFSRETYEIIKYLVEEKSFEPNFEFKRTGGARVYSIDDLRMCAQSGSFFTGAGAIRQIKGECKRGLCKGELFIQKNQLLFRTCVNVARLGVDERDVKEALTRAFKEEGLGFEYSCSSRLKGISAIPWESIPVNELNCWVEAPFSLKIVMEFISRLERIFNKIPIYYPPKQTVGRV